MIVTMVRGDPGWPLPWFGTEEMDMDETYD
jgi:hypothetical protein